MPTSAELSGFYHITYLENTMTECASEVREGDQIIRDPLEKSGICSNAVNPHLYRYVVRKLVIKGTGEFIKCLLYGGKSKG